MSHPEGMPGFGSLPDPEEAAAAMRASFERFDVASSVHTRLTDELNKTAGDRGEVVDAPADDPYLTFQWDSPGGHVTYRTPKDPRDEGAPPQVTVDRPSKALGGQLILAGGGMFTPSSVEFTINPPGATVEGLHSDNTGVPEVTAMTVSKLTHTRRALDTSYDKMYWALRESDATISGPAPRNADGTSKGRLNSGH